LQIFAQTNWQTKQNKPTIDASKLRAAKRQRFFASPFNLVVLFKIPRESQIKATAKKKESAKLSGPFTYIKGKKVTAQKNNSQ